MSQPNWYPPLNGKSCGDEAVFEAVTALRMQVRVTWGGDDTERN